MDSFKIDLQGIDRTFATHNNDVNPTSDKHATKKELTKKEEIDKLKPWVTKGINYSQMSVSEKI